MTQTLHCYIQIHTLNTTPESCTGTASCHWGLGLAAACKTIKGETDTSLAMCGMPKILQAAARLLPAVTHEVSCILLGLLLVSATKCLMISTLWASFLPQTSSESHRYTAKTLNPRPYQLPQRHSPPPMQACRGVGCMSRSIRQTCMTSTSSIDCKFCTRHHRHCPLRAASRC